MLEIHKCDSPLYFCFECESFLFLSDSKSFCKSFGFWKDLCHASLHILLKPEIELYDDDKKLECNYRTKLPQFFRFSTFSHPKIRLLSGLYIQRSSVMNSIKFLETLNVHQTRYLLENPHLEIYLWAETKSMPCPM